MDAPNQSAPAGNRRTEPTLARYRLPQNALAVAGTVLVKNDWGEPAFEIDGGTQATEDLVRVRDLRGAAACHIWGSALHSDEPIEIVDAEASILATVTRVEVSPVRDRFFVQLESGTIWTVEGQVASHEYRVHGPSGEIAEVSRRWFRARQSYGVQVAAGQPDLMVLTVALCLDLITHDSG